MEKAIYVSKTSLLGLATEEYERLYFGNEFCQRLIPTEKETRRAIGAAKEKKQGFTLVTPYVTEIGLERLKRLFRLLPDGSELVVNDWGVLRALEKSGRKIEPVLGRLLNKSKRGPRILNVIDRIPKGALSYFQKSNLSTADNRNFLEQHGIKRAELDNLLQGISVERGSETAPMKKSLYLPYAYITTTRLCLANGCESEQAKARIAKCGKECQRHTFRLTHREMPVQILLRGNTQFFRNGKMPQRLEEKGIDRIVWQPEIPM